jgi:hypothetical protein
MCPFYILFKRRLIIENPKSIALALEYIQNKLKGLKVDQIVCHDNHIDFKNRLFNGQGRWHLMAPINSGYFNYDKATSTIKYAISTSTALAFAFAFSCFVYFVSRSLTAAVLMFLWLYGMNLIIAMVRHQKFFNNLVIDLQMMLSNIS